MKKTFIAVLFLAVAMLNAQKSDSVTAYLFAHMSKENYGKLYYSISNDGLTWHALNNGEMIDTTYRGHPDIMKGHDNRYYMIGVEAHTGKMPLWVSTDLINWQIETHLPNELFMQTTGHKANKSWYGAPKLFYDAATSQYIITWHCPKNNTTKADFRGYWCSMRTFYTLTNDFKDFSAPKKLFDYDMGTIDVIIRKQGTLYYAFIKDECEATAQWPTGKSIRVCVSNNLTGPYAYPSTPISPSYHEAPMVIPKPGRDGFYVYYEEYPGVQYAASEAPAMAGPWFKVYGQRITMPEIARHGCMLEISQKEYEKILVIYGPIMPNKE